MISQPTLQSDNIMPPRRGAIIALTVDATARPYDLSTIALGAGFRAMNDRLFITLEADGGDIFYHFSPTSQNDLNDATTIAAGGTLAFANAHAAKVPSGGAVDLRIDRVTDRWLVVKTSAGTSTLRMYASSEPAPGAL